MDSATAKQLAKAPSSLSLWRGLFALFVLLVFGFSYLTQFQGLTQPEAMEQAQIARNVARGEGLTTQFLRPQYLMAQALAYDESEGEAAAEPSAPSLQSFSDVNLAPLPILSLALAFKLTGMDDATKTRMQQGGSSIYAPDRVVSCLSLFFVLLALFLSYFVITTLFSEAIAAASVLILSTCPLVHQYAFSGLSQGMMLCCLLLSVMMLTRACQRPGAPTYYVSFALLFALVMPLCGWASLALTLAIFLFVTLAFRKVYLYSLTAGALLLGVMFMMPHPFDSLFNVFSIGEETILRTTQPEALALPPLATITSFVGLFFDQFSTIVPHMGNICIVPFFFLALLYTYSNPVTNKMKWCFLSLFVFAAFAMALAGVRDPMDARQVLLLLCPFFLAYSLSILWLFLDQLQLTSCLTRMRLRVGSVGILLLCSSGAWLMGLPIALSHIFTGDKSNDFAWSPYSPLALNTTLVENTNAKDVIVSDQAWAVAWYADRKALWTPLSLQDFTDDLLPFIRKCGEDVQGFLVSPSSYCQDAQQASKVGGLVGTIRKNGEFAPMVLEGTLLALSEKKNFCFLETFDKTKGLAALISSQGLYYKRIPILGAQMILYKK